MSVTAAMALTLASTIFIWLMVTQGQSIRSNINNGYPEQIQDSVNYTALLNPKGPEVQFLVFRNGKDPINLDPGDYKQLTDMAYDVNIPTKIIIHGFLSSVRQEVFFKVKNAYLESGDFNVIGMDWSVLCEFEYFSAMKGAQLAGDALSGFINYLVRSGVKLEDLHLIGHSLGAHVAGIAGDAVKNGKIGRITGLDPAGPGYNEVPPNLRLDPGDATLVDAIHTYMRILSLAQPVGHVDFYPNGGRFQPGCPEIFDIWKLPESITCNHGRSYVYFIETIFNKKAFKAQKCNTVEEAIYSRCFEESDVYMGQPETYKYGLYYVKTNTQPPFSLT